MNYYNNNNQQKSKGHPGDRLMGLNMNINNVGMNPALFNAGGGGPINNIDFNLIRKPKTPIIFSKYSGNVNNINSSGSPPINYGGGPVKLHSNLPNKKSQSSEMYSSKDNSNGHHLHTGNHHISYQGLGANLPSRKKNNSGNSFSTTGFKRPSTAPQKDKLLKVNTRPINYMNNSAGFNNGYSVGLLGPNKRVPSPMINSQQQFYNRGMPPDKFGLLRPTMMGGMNINLGGNNLMSSYKSGKKKH